MGVCQRDPGANLKSSQWPKQNNLSNKVKQYWVITQNRG